MTKRPNIEITNKVDGAVKDYGDKQGLSKSEAYEELLQHAETFRPPTENEREAHIQWLIDNRFGDEYDESPDDAEHLVKTSTTTAIDGYVPDSPGIYGTFLFAMYGYPETYALYHYDEEERELIEINREAQKS